MSFMTCFKFTVVILKISHLLLVALWRDYVFKTLS